MFAIKKHVIPVAFGLLMLVLSVGTYLQAPPVFDQKMLATLGTPTRMLQNLEQYYKDNLWLRQPLRTLYIGLRTSTGNQQENGLYLCEEGLIAAFSPSEDTRIHKQNTESIRRFAADSQLPTALLLLPTANTVYQDKLPPFAAQVQYNQPAFIQSVRQQLLGEVAVVDVYPTLQAARTEPLYYRTDSDLTSRGGYMAYTALARRLGLTPVPSTSFHQQFSDVPYYGELYREWGYPGVRPDTVSTYRLTSNPPTVRVDHWLRFEQKTYHTLYPRQATVSGNPRDMILGGHSPRITIQNDSLADTTDHSLLVLGDSNALSVLPFLALHYPQITYADPSLLTDGELGLLTPEDYSQVVFLFSMESYMNNTHPSRAATTGLVTD